MNSPELTWPIALGLLPIFAPLIGLLAWTYIDEHRERRAARSIARTMSNIPNKPMDRIS